MKTNCPIAAIFTCALRQVFVIAACVSLLLITSCATSQKVSYSSPGGNEVIKEIPGCWYRVSDDPPVYFPVGLPEDANTDYRHGEFIFAGGENTMWFVPVGGTEKYAPSELRQQAFSMRTQEHWDRIARDDLRGDVTAVVGTLFLGTLTLVAEAGSIYGSYGSVVPHSGDLFTTFEEDWDASPWSEPFRKLRFREDLHPTDALVDFTLSRMGGGMRNWSEEQLREHANQVLGEHTETAAFIALLKENGIDQ